MKAISVIVTVYNVENYIQKCLDSIINQSFPNFELIIIDDCGSDNSIKICSEKLYRSEITYKIIKNNKNKGVSESRNIGVSNSTSEYILFIDSDDWIDNTMLEKLYSTAKSNNADMVACKILNYLESSDRFIEEKRVTKGVYNSHDYLNLYFKNRTNLEICSKLIKRDIIANTRFPVRVTFEDILTLPYVIKKANKVVLLDEAMYFYVKRKESTSITGSRPKNVDGLLTNFGRLKNDFQYFSNPTGANSVNFIYTNLLVVTYILIVYSRKYSEIQKDLQSISKFIKLKDLLKFRRAFQIKHILYLFTLKTTGYLFYLGYNTMILRRTPTF